LRLSEKSISLRYEFSGRTILNQLEVAYLRVKEGNRLLRGYLASVVKVAANRIGFLTQIGLPDLQSQIAEKADKLAVELGTGDGPLQSMQDKLKTATN